MSKCILYCCYSTLYQLLNTGYTVMPTVYILRKYTVYTFPLEDPRINCNANNKTNHIGAKRAKHFSGLHYFFYIGSIVP